MTSPLGMQTGATQGLKGTGYRQASLSNWTPEQFQMFQQAQGLLGPGSQLSQLASGDPSIFAQLEAPAMTQFGQLQGNIASRFSGMGGMGARKSGGFQNALSGAATDLSERLQSQRMGLQHQAIQELLGGYNSMLQQRPYENMLLEKKKPFWQQLLLGLVPGVAQGVGTGGSLWGMGKLGLI